MGLWQDHACKLLCMPCVKIAGRLRVASIFQRQGVRARTASRNELLFRETVSAIGAGGVITLQRLLSEHLRLGKWWGKWWWGKWWGKWAGSPQESPPGAPTDPDMPN